MTGAGDGGVMLMGAEARATRLLNARDHNCVEVGTGVVCISIYYELCKIVHLVVYRKKIKRCASGTG